MVRYLLPVLALSLAGCATIEQAEPPSWSPPVLAEPEPQQVQHGSLYDATYSTSLFDDRRAYRVGDILTVKLDEKTRTSKSAETSFDKESGFEAVAPLIWGDTGKDTDVSSSRSFAGDGASSMENMLDGSITVSVIGVRGNGTLTIRGEKWLTLNQGDEYIRISGILRSEDISPDNTVSSQRLANARITYSANGAIADANEAGWLSRLFNHPIAPM